MTTIYHNPACGTSRNTLALIRNTGEEPTIIDYLKTPPTKADLIEMINAAGLSVRDAIRQKGTPYTELSLDNLQLSDDALIDAMLANPILINRPFVIADKGTRLCRPSELVLDILSRPQQGAFIKEDGEAIINAEGKRVTKSS